MQICYPAEAVRYGAQSSTWSLDAAFDAACMALQVGPADAAGRVVLHDAQGRERARGVPLREPALHLHSPEGGVCVLERWEIAACRVLIASAALEPGLRYHEATAAPPVLHPGTAALTALAALGPGAMLSTDAGELPAEWLRPGDRVLTRDNGYQPLVWVARIRCPGEVGEGILLPADAFGARQPQRPLLVSPGQGLLLAALELHLWFGESEMLARADALAEAFGVAPVAIASDSGLCALACASPQLILADGLWLDTAQPDAGLLAALAAGARAQLWLAPAPAPASPVRATLDAWEVAMFAPPLLAARQRLAA